jgi:hypothetical protein
MGYSELSDEIYIYYTTGINSNYALNARNEMKVVSRELIELANTKRYNLRVFTKLVELV